MKNKILQSLESYPFHHKLTTRWRDQDPFRHVNNAIFLSYLEDGRTSLFKRWSIDYKRKSLIVASIKIDYLRQVDHPSELIIGQRVSRIGTKSFDIDATIFNDNAPCCTSTVTTVCYDFINNKSVDIFQEIIDDYNYDT